MQVLARYLFHTVLHGLRAFIEMLLKLLLEFEKNHYGQNYGLHRSTRKRTRNGSTTCWVFRLLKRRWWYESSETGRKQGRIELGLGEEGLRMEERGGGLYSRPSQV